MKKRFMGEYNHSIDSKGRVIVPSKFREILGDDFVVTKGMEGCLWIFPEEEWDVFSEKLHSLPEAKKDARNYARFFMSGASDAACDKQGRLLLSQVLRDFAHIEKEVTLVGIGSRVEIWNRGLWEELMANTDMDEIEERMGEAGFGI